MTAELQQPIRCILEMTEDGQLGIIVPPDCSPQEARDLIRHLATCGGHFDHLVYADDDELFT